MSNLISIDEALCDQRLKALEHRYRSALNGLASARAACAALSEVVGVDDLTLKLALQRVQRQQMRLAELQVAMEKIEDAYDAV